MIRSGRVEQAQALLPTLPEGAAAVRACLAEASGRGAAGVVQSLLQLAAGRASLGTASPLDAAALHDAVESACSGGHAEVLFHLAANGTPMDGAGPLARRVAEAQQVACMLAQGDVGRAAELVESQAARADARAQRDSTERRREMGAATREAKRNARMVADVAQMLVPDVEISNVHALRRALVEVDNVRQALLNCRTRQRIRRERLRERHVVALDRLQSAREAAEVEVRRAQGTARLDVRGA